MAHKRGENYRPTTTITLEKELLEKIEDFRFTTRKENRSQAIAELVVAGLQVKQQQIS